MKLARIDDTEGPICLNDREVLTNDKAWGHCLIAFVLGRNPGIQGIDIVRASWKVPNKVYRHRSGWMVFRFETEEARDAVLQGGPYASFGRQWLLKTMPEYFRFDEQTFNSIPIWVQLRGLPLECWTKAALSKIGSRIGVPLSSDKVTNDRSNPSFARLLVEVDTTKGKMESVAVVLPNGRQIEVEVIYETEPIVCSSCKRLGHAKESCRTIMEKDSTGIVQKQVTERRNRDTGKDRNVVQHRVVVDGRTKSLQNDMQERHQTKAAGKKKVADEGEASGISPGRFAILQNDEELVEVCDVGGEQTTVEEKEVGGEKTTVEENDTHDIAQEEKGGSFQLGQKRKEKDDDHKVGGAKSPVRRNTREARGTQEGRHENPQQCRGTEELRQGNSQQPRGTEELRQGNSQGCRGIEEVRQGQSLRDDKVLRGTQEVRSNGGMEEIRDPLMYALVPCCPADRGTPEREDSPSHTPALGYSQPVDVIIAKDGEPAIDLRPKWGHKRHGKGKKGDAGGTSSI